MTAPRAGARFELARVDEADGSLAYAGTIALAGATVRCVVAVRADGCRASIDGGAFADATRAELEKTAAALVRAATKPGPDEAAPPRKIVRWRALASC